jgi:transcriptional regulator with XRE-family HTH domain
LTWPLCAVKRLRKGAEITQQELAFKAGIDLTYACQIERSVANPSLGTICQIADSLDCKPEELFLKAYLKRKKPSPKLMGLAFLF